MTSKVQGKQHARHSHPAVPVMGAATLCYRVLHAIHLTPVGPWVTTLLMLIMLGMGVHLKVDDFKRVLSRPAPVAAGIFLHYLVMPLAAWILALAFHMPPELSAGMVLVGSVASGTASNVMIYLAKGDVALSVTISSVSTLVGVVATTADTTVCRCAYSGGCDGNAAQHSTNCRNPNRSGSGHSPSVPTGSQSRGAVSTCFLNGVHSGDHQRSRGGFRVTHRIRRLCGDYRRGFAQHYRSARWLLGRKTIWLR